MRSVLLTGASTGIGQATALYLASNNWNVFAGVRKQEDADKLSELNSSIQPLILDVTQSEQITSAIQHISQEIGCTKLSGLINNAGVANMGPLALQPMEEIRWHYEVNVFGLIEMTKAALPLLGMDKAREGAPGRIINISSVGGRLAAPFLGAYASTKHAVESLTDSFRRELMPFGIDAISIGPGAVKTPIWDKAEEKNEDQPYQGSAWEKSIEIFSQIMLNGGRTGLPAEDIARVVETALTVAKPKARYAPVPNKLTNWTIPSRLPKRMVDKAMADRFGLNK